MLREKAVYEHIMGDNSVLEENVALNRKNFELKSNQKGVLNNNYTYIIRSSKS